MYVYSVTTYIERPSIVSSCIVDEVTLVCGERAATSNNVKSSSKSSCTVVVKVRSLDRHSAAYGIEHSSNISSVMIAEGAVCDRDGCIIDADSTTFVASECVCGDIDMMIGILKVYCT